MQTYLEDTLNSFVMESEAVTAFLSHFNEFMTVVSYKLSEPVILSYSKRSSTRGEILFFFKIREINALKDMCFHLFLHPKKV